MSELLDNYLLFIMVFIGVLVVFYGVYVWIQSKKSGTTLSQESELKNNEPKEKQIVTEITQEDKELFQEMLKILPYDKGSLAFLKTSTLNDEFHSSKLDDLYNFYYDWNSNSHKFPNTQLEENRSQLYIRVGDYIKLLIESIEERESGYIKVTKNRDKLPIEAQKMIEGYKEFLKSTQMTFFELEGR